MQTRIDLIALGLDGRGAVLLHCFGWLNDDGVILANLDGSIVDHLLDDVGRGLVLIEMIFSLLDSLSWLGQLDHGGSLLLLLHDCLLLILANLNHRPPSLVAYFAEIVGLALGDYSWQWVNDDKDNRYSRLIAVLAWKAW